MNIVACEVSFSKFLGGWRALLIGLAGYVPQLNSSSPTHRSFLFPCLTLRVLLQAACQLTIRVTSSQE